jgi:hypothetical protein
MAQVDAESEPRKPIKRWWVVVYRVPTEPTSRRVTVWRDLKRTGALYLQQCVCILPDVGPNRQELDRIAARIAAMGGEVTRFEVRKLDPADEAKIVEGFRQQRSNEYAEIVEECEVKFVKEVEFEHFRQNYTFEELEEIEQDLEKIRRWYDRVRARDWFEAPRRGAAAQWLERCQELLDGFGETVYRQSELAPPLVETTLTAPPPTSSRAPAAKRRPSRRAAARSTRSE